MSKSLALPMTTPISGVVAAAIGLSAAAVTCTPERESAAKTGLLCRRKLRGRVTGSNPVGIAAAPPRRIGARYAEEAARQKYHSRAAVHPSAAARSLP